MNKEEELEKVKNKILSCKLPLKESATNLVFGKGNPDADIMFIGEAPGEKEDLQGVPFVGAAGRELDKLLSILGLTLKDVYIANILKYRPPNNRDPTEEEIRAHTPHLVEQIRIIHPKVIATLGNFATKFVLARFDVGEMKRIGGISHLHGKPVEVSVDELKFTVIPMYHPAAMLYKPPLRKIIEDDFTKMGEVIGIRAQAKTGKKNKELTEFFNQRVNDEKED